MKTYIHIDTGQTATQERWEKEIKKANELDPTDGNHFTSFKELLDSGLIVEFGGDKDE